MGLIHIENGKESCMNDGDANALSVCGAAPLAMI